MEHLVERLPLPEVATPEKIDKVVGRFGNVIYVVSELSYDDFGAPHVHVRDLRAVSFQEAAYRRSSHGRMERFGDVWRKAVLFEGETASLEEYCAALTEEEIFPDVDYGRDAVVRAAYPEFKDAWEFPFFEFVDADTDTLYVDGRLNEALLATIDVHDPSVMARMREHMLQGRRRHLRAL